MKRITVEKKNCAKKPPCRVKKGSSAKKRGSTGVCMLHKILARGYPTNIGLLAGASCIISETKKTKKKQKMIGWYPKPAFEDGF
jgi:hypothetical protein